AEGSVYFDEAAWSRDPDGDYGHLFGNRPEDVDQGESADLRGKRDPRDFALWKAAKPGEPSWPTPWGDGQIGRAHVCTTVTFRSPHVTLHAVLPIGPRAASPSTWRPGPAIPTATTGTCPATGPRTWTRASRRTCAASGTPATSPCGRPPSRASPAGPPRGATA